MYASVKSDLCEFLTVVYFHEFIQISFPEIQNDVVDRFGIQQFVIIFENECIIENLIECHR